VLRLKFVVRTIEHARRPNPQRTPSNEGEPLDQPTLMPLASRHAARLCRVPAPLPGRRPEGRAGEAPRSRTRRDPRNNASPRDPVKKLPAGDVADRRPAWRAEKRRPLSPVGQRVGSLCDAQTICPSSERDHQEPMPVARQREYPEQGPSRPHSVEKQNRQDAEGELAQSPAQRQRRRVWRDPRNDHAERRSGPRKPTI